MQVDGSRSSSQDSDREIRTLKLSVALYVVVMALKLAGYAFTGVMALLAEGLHTLSDIFVSGFLLAAAYGSRRPPDEDHPYGHGRAQYAGALVAATLFLSFTSYELYKEAIPRLFKDELAQPNNLSFAIAVLAISVGIGLVPMISLFRQKNRGAAARAQLLELVNDQLGLVAALIGTVLLMFGFPKADPLAAIAVATIIAVNGVKLFWENFSYLLGRTPPAAILSQIVERVGAVNGVLGVSSVKAELIASDAMNAHLHIEVRRGLPIDEADRIAHAVAEVVKGLMPGNNYVSVHVDPSSQPDAQVPSQES